MARLLRNNDYLRLIQSDNLAQIIESNEQIKLDVEQAAQAEMISYLSQRYIVSEIFTNTTEFDASATYRAKNLVEFTAATYSSASTYNIGDYVVYTGYVYKCNTNATTGAWNATKWDVVCLDKQLYYVTLPEAEFDYDTTYSIGDVVWYQNYTYTCAVACVNIKPTETQYWTVGTEYTITGDYPDDDTKWTLGDNRNQQIVLFLIDITLYHLHSRINPRNVPDLRKERYNGNSPTDSGGALGWLKSVASAKVNADLPEIAPEQGLSMRYGNSATSITPSNNMLW